MSMNTPCVFSWKGESNRASEDPSLPALGSRMMSLYKLVQFLFILRGKQIFLNIEHLFSPHPISIFSLLVVSDDPVNFFLGLMRSSR